MRPDALCDLYELVRPKRCHWCPPARPVRACPGSCPSEKAVPACPSALALSSAALTPMAALTMPPPSTSKDGSWATGSSPHSGTLPRPWVGKKAEAAWHASAHVGSDGLCRRFILKVVAGPRGQLPVSARHEMRGPQPRGRLRAAPRHG